jgi:hypothetical protein
LLLVPWPWRLVWPLQLGHGFGVGYKVVSGRSHGWEPWPFCSDHRRTSANTRPSWPLSRLLSWESWYHGSCAFCLRLRRPWSPCWWLSSVASLCFTLLVLQRRTSGEEGRPILERPFEGPYLNRSACSLCPRISASLATGCRLTTQLIARSSIHMGNFCSSRGSTAAGISTVRSRRFDPRPPKLACEPLSGSAGLWRLAANPEVNRSSRRQRLPGSSRGSTGSRRGLRNCGCG